MAKSILDYALENGLITDEQHEKAEHYRRESGANESTVLLDMKLLDEERLAVLYSQMYGYRYIKELPQEDLPETFDYGELTKYGFVPIVKDKKILIATANPAKLLYAEDLVRDKTGYKGKFDYGIITVSTLAKMLEGAAKGSENLDLPETDGGDQTDSGIYDISENDSSAVVSAINKIFRDAVENNISDIHFEPQEDNLTVRFREDGTLKKRYELPKSAARQLANRIKTMASADVNTSKAIQDGNTRLDIFGRCVDLRISVIPAVNGENIVVRILDQNKGGADLSMIGFSEENERKFLKLIKRPQGIILLTGPTGSGKSTSLYAALSVLNSEDRCIITFEDPIEYRMPGIVQVQINPAMGVTFPQALKSGLRQDIEVALVGEIRDRETASIAFDAANTGHMVLSTLHTNSAASSILRLVKMGIEPYVVSRSLVAVINQRLAKRICPDCREEYFLDKNSPYRKILGCGDKPVKLYRGRGCDRCGGTGYRGRIALQEFLVVTNEIGDLLDRGASTNEIEQAAISAGMVKIHKDGINKALSGLTTLDEVHRVVFFDDL